MFIPKGFFFFKDVLLSSVYFTYSHTRSYSCSNSCNDNVYWPSAKAYFFKKNLPSEKLSILEFPGEISHVLTDDPPMAQTAALRWLAPPSSFARAAWVCSIESGLQAHSKEGLGPSLLSARFCWSGGSGVSPTGSEACGAQRWGEEASRGTQRVLSEEWD